MNQLRRRSVGFGLLLLTAAALSGCGEDGMAVVKFREGNRNHIAQGLKIGMTEEQVHTLMAKGLPSSLSTSELGSTPICLSNPHMSEVRIIGEKRVTIRWYYTHLEKNDLLISPEELTPIVFCQG